MADAEPDQNPQNQIDSPTPNGNVVVSTSLVKFAQQNVASFAKEIIVALRRLGSYALIAVSEYIALEIFLHFASQDIKQYEIVKQVVDWLKIGIIFISTFGFATHSLMQFVANVAIDAIQQYRDVKGIRDGH